MPPVVHSCTPTIRGMVEALIVRGGPLPEDDPVLDGLLQEAWRWALYSGDFDGCAGMIRKWFGPVLSPETLQGLALLKPRGYAGDFEIIDRIYRGHLSQNPDLVGWDRFYHRQAAPQAVRNRKDYFHDVLDRHAGKQGPVRVLKIASGPGRGMFEWMSLHPGADVTFDCVEIDGEAIGFARELNAPFLDRIRFHHGNALRFRPRETYGLVWAAGIFDYFADPVFVSLLKRLKPAMAPGGEMIVGNFSESNPSRPYMELLGDWHLHHRSPDQLVDLAMQAGFPARHIRVGNESLGVNLFLHVTTDG